MNFIPENEMGVVVLFSQRCADAGYKIIEAQQGNICRCITYNRIKSAIRRASDIMQGA